jgi:tRNA nucleotidyltransferase (CCA-adding enzyme)
LESVLRRLRFSNQEQKEIRLLLQGQAISWAATDGELRSWLSELGVAHWPLALQLLRARLLALGQQAAWARAAELEHRARALLERGFPMSLRELAVNGADLLALGVAKGPELGRILNELWRLALTDPSRNTRDRLLGHAGELLGQHPTFEKH